MHKTKKAVKIKPLHTHTKEDNIKSYLVEYVVTGTQFLSKLLQTEIAPSIHYKCF